MNNQFYETTPTESAAGGTHLYILISLLCKPHVNLSMYKKNQLQSTFIKIISSEKSNTIVFINFLIWFFKNFIRLLDNDLKEQKQIFLLKDFNINLLIYNEHQPTNKCLGSPSSKFYNFLCFTATKKLLLTQKLLLITFF